MECLTVHECERWRNQYCRRKTWKRQATCVTPLKRLPWFTAALVDQLRPSDHALLMVDQVVFDVPPELETLRRRAGERQSLHDAPGLASPPLPCSPSPPPHYFPRRDHQYITTPMTTIATTTAIDQFTNSGDIG